MLNTEYVIDCQPVLNVSVAGDSGVMLMLEFLDTFIASSGDSDWPSEFVTRGAVLVPKQPPWLLSLFLLQ